MKCPKGAANTVSKTRLQWPKILLWYQSANGNGMMLQNVSVSQQGLRPATTELGIFFVTEAERSYGRCGLPVVACFVAIVSS